jgi:hypothetical protein
LYDLREDPMEQRNLAAASPHAPRLARQLEQWFLAQGAPPLKDWRSTTAQTLPAYKGPE